MNTAQPVTSDKIGSVAWAVVFIWTGVALIANVLGDDFS